MKTRLQSIDWVIFICLSFLILSSNNVNGCSTFKLDKGGQLIYAHNLNQGDIGVPGMVFINKRGVFKTGRTWSELTTLEGSNPSSLTWISRYGSVTFNAFGKDLPDGGMNEAGLYIWEMNEDADYPENTGLPKLDQMNWMQYLLDQYASTEEAIKCASEIEVSGWGWHFFVGDAQGNTAAIAFIDGKVLVHQGHSMPVPGLFNTPYQRELELLKYYRGYGGQYEIDLEDPQVPRFVKTAALLEAYDSSQDVVKYGFHMLEKITVNDVPEWSVIFDVRSGDLHFKTRKNPEIKSLSMKEIDFSNLNPVKTLNMDAERGGDVSERFQAYSNESMKEFIRDLVVPILPEEFFTGGGLTIADYLDRTSRHSDRASEPEVQFFKGEWKTSEDIGLTLTLLCDQDRVKGSVSNGKDVYEVDHLAMTANKLTFTFRTKGKRLMEARATIVEDSLEMELYTIEEAAGVFQFSR
jgi:choloylglycine hydrolase